MTYKVIEKVTIARNFKNKEQAELWASFNLSEDEDRTYEVKKE